MWFGNHRSAVNIINIFNLFVAIVVVGIAIALLFFGHEKVAAYKGLQLNTPEEAPVWRPASLDKSNC